MLEACWRHAGGRLEASLKDLHLFGQTGGWLGLLEAGWRQAGGRLEGDHLRIYTFLAKLEAGLGGVSRSLTKHNC